MCATQSRLAIHLIGVSRDKNARMTALKCAVIFAEEVHTQEMVCMFTRANFRNEKTNTHRVWP